MCGIAGVFVFEGEYVTGKVIHTMTERLSHRGPDDSGCVVFGAGKPAAFTALDGNGALYGSVALGHRRLSIIDVSPLGHQPMPSSDGKLWVVFNGEIYNYVELREELERAGHQFRSHTDTEVVLAAYRQWGLNCFTRFNGMWAMAIYDLASRRMVLSRDRFGKKPLYYHIDSKGLVFASEPKAVFASLRVPKRPDLRKIANYAGRHYRYVDDTPASFFEGVCQVPRSQALVFGVRGEEGRKTYWALQPGEALTARWSETEIVERFRGLLDDAVRLRLRSDVPVGAMLSGGMDSTSITCLAARRHPCIRTFSSVTGSGYYDESAYIKDVVQASGADATYIYPAETDLMATLAEMLRFHDEPVCTPSWYSIYMIVREIAKARVPVVLTGHAGDELLAGYWDHYHYFFRDLRCSAVDNDVAEKEAWLKNHGRDPQEYDRERDFVESLEKDPSAAIRRFSNNLECLRSPIRSLAIDPRHQSLFRGALDRRLYLELLYETVPASLRAEDRNCMAFSIENRVPFLDYRLVEFAFALPGRYKIRNGLGKWLLREAMKGVLPESVRTRKDKTGHNLPFDTWLRGAHKAEVEALMSRRGFVNDEIYDVTAVREKFAEHQRGANHYMFFWQYINMHIWHEQQFSSDA